MLPSHNQPNSPIPLIIIGLVPIGTKYLCGSIIIRSQIGINYVADSRKIEILLKSDMVVDISTVGRKSKNIHRIEIRAHFIKGRIFIASRPGRRDWHANLISCPNFSLHLKDEINADIRAIARNICDRDERYDIFDIIRKNTTYTERIHMIIDQWVASSCPAEVCIQNSKLL